MPAGRPPKYDTPADIERIGEAFFADCDEKEHAPTMAGLAIALGFVDRQSLYDYEKREEFSCAIKALRLRVEAYHERCLSGTTVTGHIFWLKNHKWRDESYQNVEETRKVISSEPLSADEWSEKYGNE